MGATTQRQCRSVWIRLVNSIGDEISSSSANTISMGHEALVADLSERLKTAYNRARPSGESFESLVYANIQHLNNSSKPLSAWVPLDALGQSEKDPVLVVLIRSSDVSDIDASQDWTQDFLLTQLLGSELPPVEDLRTFLKQPLSVKIAILPDLISMHHLQEDHALWAHLFVAHEHASCLEFVADVLLPILRQHDPGRTQPSFISFWDAMIRKVLLFIFPNAALERYSSAWRCLALMKRPELTFTMESVCVLRGEEVNANVNLWKPHQALCYALQWDFTGVPYLFGYAAAGHSIQLCALPRHTHEGQVSTVLLGTFDLADPSGRLQWLLALLNCCRLFPALVSL